MKINLNNETGVITIDGVEYILKPDVDCDDMEYCIFRCKDAGVHAGYLKDHPKGTREVTIVNARRLYRWYSRTLSELSQHGSSDNSKSLYMSAVPEMTVLDCCEIIPCSPRGKKSIIDMPVGGE